MKRFFIILFLVFVTSHAAVTRAQTKFYIYQKTGEYNIAPWLRYNKADGLFTGLSGQFFFNENFWLNARAGYAFSLKKPRYKAGLEKILPAGEDDYFLTLDYFRMTHSNDFAVIPDWQNSLASSVARLDYYDHYDLHGGRLTFGKHWRGIIKTALTFGYNRYATLETATQKSLFDWGGACIDGKRRFAPNPPVKKGDDAYAEFVVDYDPRPSPHAFLNAWLIRAEYDISRWAKQSRTDFSYQRLDLSVQRQQRLFIRQRLAAQLAFRSHEGKSNFYSASDGANLPQEQFLYDIGGQVALRGYRYKEFTNGNRMLLGKLDYAFNGGFFPKTPFAKCWGVGWLFRKFDLTLFADAGQIWTADDNAMMLNPEGFRFHDMKYSAGAGLAMIPWIRFDVAFPLNKTEYSELKHPVFYFTFNLNI